MPVSKALGRSARRRVAALQAALAGGPTAWQPQPRTAAPHLHGDTPHAVLQAQAGQPLRRAHDVAPRGERVGLCQEPVAAWGGEYEERKKRKTGGVRAVLQSDCCGRALPRLRSAAAGCEGRCVPCRQGVAGPLPGKAQRRATCWSPATHGLGASKWRLPCHPRELVPPYPAERAPLQQQPKPPPAQPAVPLCPLWNKQRLEEPRQAPQRPARGVGCGGDGTAGRAALGGASRGRAERLLLGGLGCAPWESGCSITCRRPATTVAGCKQVRLRL